MAIDWYKTFFDYVGIFFIIYMIGYASFLFVSVTTGSSSLYQLKRSAWLKNELPQDYYVPISIIVPAYNEEVTIEASIRSLLALEYKLYEIIVVDDGSSDNTSKIVKEAFDMKKVTRPIHREISCNDAEAIYESFKEKVPITLIRKVNGGKADALNMGINASKFPYFICMDADSVLQYDSLEKIVRPVLEDGNVVAVGGAIRPCNGAVIENGRVRSYKMPDKILPAMQVLEYDRSFLATRILFDKFNGNIIISGAFGLFNKQMVISAGGYDVTTMGEDMELVIKLHVFCRENNIDYNIRYASDAICWTQAPEKLKDLCKQRKRWHIGLFQSMIRHRRILFNYRYGLVGMVSYLYFLIYELLSPYIEVFGIITILIGFLVDLINVPFMIVLFFIYVTYSTILSITAFFARIHTVDLKLSFQDVLKALSLCMIEVSCLRGIMAWVRTFALVGYKKKKHVWGSIERKKLNFK